MKIYKKNSSLSRTVFDLEEKQKQIEKLTQESATPDFWEDNERAAKVSQELSDVKEEIDVFQKLKKEIIDVAELAKLSKGDADALAELPGQVVQLEKRIKKEEFRTFLSGKYDKGNAVLTITAGAGGQDAQDWTTILLRMYERYCRERGWKVQVLHQSFSDMGPEGRIGTKQVSLEVQGSYAYGFLKGENGIHRLVRISPFSTKSLRHTSFASIEVIPEIDVAVEKDIEIDLDDIRVDTFRASGPGGQYVNKRETAVRVTHEPTGIVASSQAGRSQQQNKEKALQMLAAKLYQLKQREREQELAKVKGKQAAIEWGSQIRSYVLHPYTMVKDHRTNVEVSDVEEVLDGSLQDFIEAEIKLTT